MSCTFVAIGEIKVWRLSHQCLVRPASTLWVRSMFSSFVELVVAEAVVVALAYCMVSCDGMVTCLEDWM